ncbi:hypothetical protein NMY22_g4807 [Coprinellus aureogranulatus]|nr:hypothetical protein NMY22_g4807 [Coprinellus aureogranulatus]
MAAPSLELIRAVSHLAATNVPANPQILGHIREILEDIDKETVELKAQLLVITQRLHDLDLERARFQPIVAPIRRVPLEILGDIFGLVLQQSSGPQSVLSELCQVCRSWKEAAHSIPKFWQHTSIDLSKAQRLPHGPITSWINRARSLPRTIHLHEWHCGRTTPRKEGSGSTKSVCHFSNPALPRILKDGPTLDKVSIECPTPQCLEQLSVSLQSFRRKGGSPHWDSMQSFRIELHSKEDWTSISSLTLNFLPRSIRSLDLELPDSHDILSRGLLLKGYRFSIPEWVLERLVVLKLGCNWSANYILKWLQMCANLEELELDLRRGWFGSYRDEPYTFVQSVAEEGVALPKLRTLSVKGVLSCDIDTLCLLRFPPTFSSLSITLGQDDWLVGDWLDEHGSPNVLTSEDRSSLSKFVRGDPSKPTTLKSLHITNGVFEDNILFDTLKNLSSLKHLVIENAVFDANLFSEISSQDMLPRLRRLDLLKLHEGSQEIDGLHEFVQERGIELTISHCEDTDCGCRPSTEEDW